MLCEDLLTAERAVTAASPVGVTANLTIGVSGVVAVLLVEGIVGNLVEALSPEYETLLQIEPYTFQEKCVL